MGGWKPRCQKPGGVYFKAKVIWNFRIKRKFQEGIGSSLIVGIQSFFQRSMIQKSPNISEPVPWPLTSDCISRVIGNMVLELKKLWMVITPGREMVSIYTYIKLAIV